MSTTMPAITLGGVFSPTVPVFLGKVWVVGNASTHIFTSSNLTTWVDSGATSPSMGFFQLVVYNGKLYNWNGGQVSYSTDGLIWAQVPQLGDTGIYFNLAVNGTSVYGLSTISGTVYSSRSSDGITFTNTATNLSASRDWWLVVFGGVLYALPNTTTASSVSGTRVFTSTDSITWTAVGTAWGVPLCRYGFIINSSKAYVFGGIGTDFNTSNLVYSSSDMITWSLESYSSVWPGRKTPAAVSFDGVPVIFGGLDSSNTQFYDIWHVASVSPTPPASIPL